MPTHAATLAAPRSGRRLRTALLRRPAVLAVAGIGLLIVMLVAGVAAGTVTIPPGDTIAILAHRLLGLDVARTWSPAQETIVMDLRLPRVLMAMTVGVGLAISGATFQGLLRNPLADPYVLGTASGAALGAAVAVILPFREVIFEFGPLWLVALAAPAVLFGPYWASLMSAGGLGGLLADKIRMTKPKSVLVVVALMLAASVVLTTIGWVVAVIVAQVVLVLLLGIAGIHVGAMLHDAVPSAIRAGVASGAGTISWIGFLPFALTFGWVTQQYGMHASGWMITAAIVAVGGLLLRMSLRQPAAAVAAEIPALVPIPAAVAC